MVGNRRLWPGPPQHLCLRCGTRDERLATEEERWRERFVGSIAAVCCWSHDLETSASAKRAIDIRGVYTLISREIAYQRRAKATLSRSRRESDSSRPLKVLTCPRAANETPCDADRNKEPWRTLLPSPSFLPSFPLLRLVQPHFFICGELFLAPLVRYDWLP